MYAVLLACLLLLGVTTASAAQQPSAPSVSSVLPSDSLLRVFVMTMGPGKEVWDRYGHDAIWVADPRDETSISYNYGMFSFEQENFILHFLQGRLWYWMAGFPAERYADMYVRLDRSVWIQELNLTPAQKRDLRDFLRWNAEEEHKFYFYDYYRDNCATRVRDALDRVLGGRIRRATESVPTTTTFRWHTRRLTQVDPPIYTGINMALGQPTDRPITRWEEMFLPLEVQARLREIRVPGPDGGEVPLVKAEYTLYQSTKYTDPAAPPRWIPWYLLIGAVVGGAAWLLGRRGARTWGAGARRGFGLVAGVWTFVAGLAGVILVGLWGFTDHVATYRNENVLQLCVLALPLALVLPRLAAGSRRAARIALPLAALVAGLSVLGLLLKVLPGFYQHNGEVIALVLPAHLGVLAGTAALARRVRAS